MRGFCSSTFGATLFLLLAIAAPLAAAPVDEGGLTEGVELNNAERAFAAAMSGASLVGRFTIDGGDPGAAARLRPERYDLGEVRKVGDGKWMLQTRIRYGGKDLTLPITVPIEWVGAKGETPTPVVVIDELFFPGAGTYSARVLFHQGHYAGHWSGAEHGGLLFGKIEPASEHGSEAKTAGEAP